MLVSTADIITVSILYHLKGQVHDVLLIYENWPNTSMYLILGNLTEAKRLVGQRTKRDSKFRVEFLDPKSNP